MRRILFFSTVLILAGCMLHAPVVQAKKKRERPKRVKKIHTPIPARFVLVPRVTAGIVKGAAAELMDELDYTFQDRIVYGLGLRGEFVVSPKVAVSIDYESAYKDLPAFDNSLRANSYGAGLMYRFRPEAARSIYLRTEWGRVATKLPMSTRADYETGTHNYIRLEIGEYRVTGSRTSARLALYYKRLFIGDLEDLAYLYDGDDDATYIGLDFALGITIF